MLSSWTFMCALAMLRCVYHVRQPRFTHTHTHTHTHFHQLHRLGSRFNHSCRPNLTWSFMQKTHLVLRTLCDVAPGE